MACRVGLGGFLLVSLFVSLKDFTQALIHPRNPR
jgi:hypothetical protein